VRLGVMVGSLLSAFLGYMILRFAKRADTPASRYD
jgi:Na+/H+ antiporter NhaA